MSKSKDFQNKDLLKQDQKYFLEVAGFVIRVVFEKSEQVEFKRIRINQFLQVYEKSGFLIKETNDKKIDFSLYWGSYIREEVYDTGNDEERFFLVGRRYLKEKKYYLSMMSSLVYFQFVLKEVLNRLLLNSGGFMMHGSGAVNNERELSLFLGHSGDGKTTTQRMLVDNDYEFFCDDVFLVRKMGNEWNFFSPPFIEKEYLPKAGEYKNARLFLVEKDRSAKVSKAGSGAKLFSKILELVWFVEEKVSKNAMENISIFVKENEIYKLERNLDVKKLMEVMNEA